MAVSSASTPTSSVTQNEFLQLMVKQLQSQDPLNPTDNGQMLAQLAQFSTLSGMEQLNASFSDMLSLQEITQGSNLIGKQVAYTKSDGSQTTGKVASVEITNGQVSLQVGNDSVALGQVIGVASAA